MKRAAPFQGMSASIGSTLRRAAASLLCFLASAGTAPAYVVTNTASVFWESETGSKGLVTSSTTFTVTDGPALALLKSSLSATDLGPGQDAVFTLSINNTGGDTAFGVVVLDTLPALLSYRPGTATAAADPGWDPLPGPPEVLRWTVGALAPGSATSFSYTVRTGTPGADTVAINRAVVHYGAGYGIPMPPEAAAFPVMVRAALPPAAPGALSAVGLTAGVRLGWVASAAGTRPVSGYNVYRAIGGPVVPGIATFVTQVPGGAVTTWTDGGLAPGTTYCYVLRAVDAAGLESGDSAEACAATAAGAPDVTVVKSLAGPSPIKAGEVTAFSLIVQNNGDATAFNVVVMDTIPAVLAYVGPAGASPSPDAGWTPETSLPQQRVRWTIPTLDIGAFALLAYEAKGVDPGPTPVTALNEATAHSEAAGPVTMPPDVDDASVTVDPTALPGPAAPLTARPAGLVVGLQWSPAAAGDFAVSGYNIYRTTYAGFAPAAANLLAQAVGATASTHVDATVAPGQGYVWIVRAVDVLGNEGPATNEATAGLVAPGTPLTLTARVAGPGIALGWQPAAAGTAPVSAYLVYRSSTSGFAPGAGNLLAAVSGATASVYTDAAPAAGITWFYVVRATDGSLTGPASGEAFATVPVTIVVPPPPPPPTEGPVRLVVTVYDASGRAVRTVVDRMIGAAPVLARVEPDPGTPGVIVFVLSDGTRIVWDGRDAAGAPVPNGVYTVRVTDRLPDGRESVTTAGFAYTRPFMDVIESAALVPNPATESVWLSYRLASTAAIVDVRIYNVAGELVFKTTVNGAARQYRWDLRNADGRRVTDGMYIVVLDALDPATRSRDRQMLKLAVTRP